MNEKEVTVQHMCHALEHAWRATDALQLHSQVLFRCSAFGNTLMTFVIPFATVHSVEYLIRLCALPVIPTRCAVGVDH